MVSPRRSAIFTFPASEFYDRPLVVVNVGNGPSFLDLGFNRIGIGAGEERSFDVLRGADYQIGLGPRVRLVDTKQELVAKP